MKWFTILALALAIGLATAASPFASSSPDGLERVAGDNGVRRPRARGAARARWPTTRSRASTTRGWRPGSPASPGTLIVFAVGVRASPRVVRR